LNQPFPLAGALFFAVIFCAVGLALGRLPQPLDLASLPNPFRVAMPAFVLLLILFATWLPQLRAGFIAS